MNQSSKSFDNRVVLFGTLSDFSYSTLSLLVSSRVNIVAVVLAGVTHAEANFRKHSMPIITQPGHATVEMLALEHNIPLHYINDIKDKDSLARLLILLRGLDVEYYLVACFPFRLPATIYQRPAVAALNIHPSLLPAYRGPYPVFWQLRAGKSKMGVTLHHIDAKLDCGDVVLQKTMAIKEGLHGPDIDKLMACEGAGLFIEAMALFASNTVEASIQAEPEYSYFAKPLRADFELFLNWSSRQAFNFMRGTEHWGNSYPIKIDDKNIILKSAIAYASGVKQEETIRIEVDIAYIQFSEGVLQAYIG